MDKILVIVESPGKIKKLQTILGNKYLVMASVGHIIDLDPKKMSIDIEHDFKPEYKIINGSNNKSSNKEQVVKDLKKAAKNASDILLAADEDREGEMIAWSVAYVLGLDMKTAKRITFNSITKTELDKAIKEPRKIDMNLVDAQKSRRILDRIIGFEISPILWKSIGASLSAGRVQSVVTRLLIDKENEIKDFFVNGDSNYFKLNGCFYLDKDIKLNSELYEKKQKNNAKNKDNKDKISYTKAKLNTESETRNLMKLLMKSKYEVKDIIEKDSIKNPSPPFTTSTLVQEASYKLGFTVKRTNSSAQKLYEAGYITYMRTDSVNLSTEALENIKKFVVSKYGKDYHRYLNYEAKTKNTQEAHEACRPTDVFVENINIGSKDKIGNDEVRLYNLIWKRTVASQMQPAKIKLTDIVIDANKVSDYCFISQLSNIVFQGFLVVYNLKNIINKDNNDNNDENNDINEENIISIKTPSIGTVLDVDNIKAQQEYQKPPTRFNEASLVNKLDPKNLNIGRPSTYGTIINTIQERGYVKLDDIQGIEKDSLIMCWDGGNKLKENINKIIIGKENNKLIPTSLGIIVTNFLIKYFNDIVDYKFTASMENSLDEIAEGKKIWTTVLHKFYDAFHPTVKKLLDSNETFKSESTRVLGIHPQLGHEIVATIARYGAVVKMCSSKSNCIYAPIKEPYTKDTITLEQALKLLEYPKNIGKYDKMMVTLNKGKHGLYLKWANVKASLENLNDNIKIKDPENITIDEAINVIKDKRKNILWEIIDNKIIYTILSGPYGFYININNSAKKTKNKPIRIPLKNIDEKDIKDLTFDKVKELIKTGLENKSNRYKKKNKTTKTNDNKIDTEVKKTKNIKIKNDETNTKDTKIKVVKINTKDKKIKDDQTDIKNKKTKDEQTDIKNKKIKDIETDIKNKKTKDIEKIKVKVSNKKDIK